jgi:tRNA G10  N-methylase Trm11
MTPTAPTILAATAWPTNAHLIETCAQLGYLRAEWSTLDPTYGRGRWWTRWRPDRLVTHDLALDGVDFRSLPYDAGTFDAAVFDPPYVSVGGRATTGLPDLHNRYGLTDAPTTPAALQHLIDAGLAEVTRVVRPRGVLLVKSQDYISSGRLWPGTHHTLTAAFDLGLELVDRLEHIAPRPRPQPPHRRQVHARRNLSTLLVLRKPR